MFDSDETPTPYAITTWVQHSATNADNQIARFPLRISGQGPFIAPLPFITEQERQLQQTTRDVNTLGQLYVVESVRRLDPHDLPLGEGQEVLTTRIEMGRFSQPHWQTYPANITLPTRTDQHGTVPLPQQPWLPPRAMPRHPAMAYWGRDLSDANSPLPIMHAYVTDASSSARSSSVPPTATQRTVAGVPACRFILMRMRVCVAPRRTCSSWCWSGRRRGGLLLPARRSGGMESRPVAKPRGSCLA